MAVAFSPRSEATLDGVLIAVPGVSNPASQSRQTIAAQMANRAAIATMAGNKARIARARRIMGMIIRSAREEKGKEKPYFEPGNTAFDRDHFNEGPAPDSG